MDQQRKERGTPFLWRRKKGLCTKHTVSIGRYPGVLLFVFVFFEIVVVLFFAFAVELATTYFSLRMPFQPNEGGEDASGQIDG